MKQTFDPNRDYYLPVKEPKMKQPFALNLDYYLAIKELRYTRKYVKKLGRSLSYWQRQPDSEEKCNSLKEQINSLNRKLSSAHDTCRNLDITRQILIGDVSRDRINPKPLHENLLIGLSGTISRYYVRDIPETDSVITMRFLQIRPLVDKWNELGNVCFRTLYEKTHKKERKEQLDDRIKSCKQNIKNIEAAINAFEKEKETLK